MQELVLFGMFPRCLALFLMFGVGVIHPQEVDVSDSSQPSSNGIQSMFSCARPGMNCLNDGQCDGESGSCTCADGFEGFDCSLNSSTILESESEGCECVNNGVCYNSEDEDTACSCSDVFFGQKCDKPRVSHRCIHDSMEIDITPFANNGAFSGHIYVLDAAFEDECNLDPAGNGTYTKTINLEACGGASNDTTDEGDVSRAFTILVQYDDLFLTDNDQEFVFRCLFRPPDSQVEWEDNLVSTDNAERPLQKQEVTEELLPVELDLLDENMDPVAGPQAIGTSLNLVFTLNGGAVYSSFRVEKVTATNGLTGKKLESIDFVTEGCVTPVAGQSGKKIVTSLTSETPTSVALTFKLFKFRYSSQVTFKNVVRLCRGGGSCNSTMCDDDTVEHGRKRRDISSDQAGDTMLSDLALTSTLKEEEGEGQQLERIDAAVLVLLPGSKQLRHFHGMHMRPLGAGPAATVYQPSTQACLGTTGIVFTAAACLMVLLLTVGLLIMLACRKRDNIEENIEKDSSKHVPDFGKF